MLAYQYASQANVKTAWRFFRFDAHLGYSQGKLDFVKWFKTTVSDSLTLGLQVFQCLEKEYDLWNGF